MEVAWFKEVQKGRLALNVLWLFQLNRASMEVSACLTKSSALLYQNWEEQMKQTERDEGIKG